MPGLSQKEIQSLLDHIEPQGVVITPTKKGYMLRLPDGESTMIHKSESDHRGPANLRARLKRSGIIWPTEQVNNALPSYVTKGTMHPETLDAYRALVGEQTRLKPRTVADARLEQLGHTLGETKPDITSAMRALYRLGFRPEAGTGRKTGNDWVFASKPAQLTLVPSAPVEEPAVAEPDTIEPEYPAIAYAQKIVAEHPELKPEPEPKPFVREIIDTAESWTVKVTGTIAGQTVGQLINTYKAAGLEVEIRIWQTPDTA